MVFIIKGERDLVGFEVDLFNKPGALKYVTSIPEKYGLSIAYIEECEVSHGHGTFFIVIDFSNRDVEPETILREFKNNDGYVIDARIAPTYKDLVIFPSKFVPKDLGGVRAILLGLATMKGIIHDIKEQMGEEAGEAFLYYLGLGIGKEAYRMYSELVGIDDLRDGILFTDVSTRGGGWAALKEWSMEDNKIILSIERLWECEIQRGKATKPSGVLFRGILVGFFQSLLKKRVRVIETKCIALGDPTCIFEIDILE